MGVAGGTGRTRSCQTQTLDCCAAVKEGQQAASKLRLARMARMHSGGKGQSGSTRPFVESPPEWSETDKKTIEELIIKYAREGLSTSQIGITLRDQHAIPDVKLATGERITAILSRNEITAQYPEDMMNLMRQAQRIIDHLGAGNRKDIHNRRQLELTESRLRRLAKYYRDTGRISSDWTYKRDQLRLMVE